MDENFWHQRWEKREIAFHESKTNPLLVKYLQALALPKESRIFVPLCGKTLDLHWLLSLGYHIIGAELSELAVKELFSELGVAPTITPAGSLTRYHADDIDIFVGDIFQLSRESLGPVDAIYDRAALVALPASRRGPYTAHLSQITERAPQLLITYLYDQELLAGPPFSISHEELRARYQADYMVESLNKEEVKGGLKGKCPATEEAWLLHRREAPPTKDNARGALAGLALCALSSLSPR